MYGTALSSILWYISWPVFILVCTWIISQAVKNFEKNFDSQK